MLKLSHKNNEFFMNENKISNDKVVEVFNHLLKASYDLTVKNEKYGKLIRSTLEEVLKDIDKGTVDRTFVVTILGYLDHIEKDGIIN